MYKKVGEIMKKEKEYIIRLIGINKFLKIKNIKNSDIKLEKVRETYFTYNTFSVKEGNEKYEVEIQSSTYNLVNISCSCGASRNTKLCHHIGAVLYHKIYEIDENNPTKIASSIIKDIKKDNERINNLKLELEISYDEVFEIKLKVGRDKLYQLNNKLSSFVNSYNDKKGKLNFGKNFEFNPKSDFLNNQDEQILDFLSTEGDNSNYYGTSRSTKLSADKFERLLKLLKNKSYTFIPYGQLTGYIIGSPFEIKLTKEEKQYKFKFNYSNTEFIDDDFKYAYNNKLYKIPNELRNILYKMIMDNTDEVILNDKNAVLMSKYIHHHIDDNMIIEEAIKDKFTVINPDIKLYIDFKKELECQIKLKYNDKVIDYFDYNDSYRNDKVEKLVVEDLINYGFKIENKKIFIEDLNDIVNFMENDIFELSKKYEVFTTEKYQNTTIVNNATISSNFAIGKDNIMNYEFDFKDINEKELDKIFLAMKNKKKYYKLKNGNIINTESQSLNELEEVFDNLNIDSDYSSGSIPKYRALYLDSIKDYDIINTDNSFDEFISNFTKYKNSNVKLSKKDSEILREYQKTGINWLYSIYKCDFGGILADEMGLGKTIQTIMFLKSVISEKKDAKVLIVAPTALIYNWEREFDKFGKELKYVVVADQKEKRLKTLETDNNIFITTYGLLRQDQEEYINKNFELIIIDEAQNIKNPKAGISKALKSLNSNIKIALTGTPVENSVLEVWSIFDFIMPGYLNSLTKFQTKYNVKNTDEKARVTLSTLNKSIKPFILRRKKKDVLTDLPDKIENNIYLDLLPEQKKYYAAQVKRSKEEFEQLVETEGFLKARFKILQLLTKLRQICIDPSIVFEDCKDASIKMQEVIELIQNYVENGHKILLFSSFRTAIDLLKEKFDENDISNYVIDGSVSSKNRTRLVDAFNKDNTNVFLITLKAGGTGLNLTSADVVIHFDLWWNPQVENQATDRAHRIGQKNTVEVVKLICKGTIEEKIVELQNKKKFLNDTLIDNEDAENTVISKLDEKDIKNLLSFND